MDALIALIIGSNRQCPAWTPSPLMISRRGLITVMSIASPRPKIMTSLRQNLATEFIALFSRSRHQAYREPVQLFRATRDVFVPSSTAARTSRKIALSDAQASTQPIFRRSKVVPCRSTAHGRIPQPPRLRRGRADRDNDPDPIPAPTATAMKVSIPAPRPNHCSAAAKVLASFSRMTGSPAFQKLGAPRDVVPVECGRGAAHPLVASTGPLIPTPTPIMREASTPDEQRPVRRLRKWRR